MEECAAGGGFLGARDGAPEIELTTRAAQGGFPREFAVGNRGQQRGADECDVVAEFAPIAFAVGAAEYAERAARGGHVAGEDFEEGGFAGAVGTEERPVLARLDAPVDVAEEGVVAALDGEVLNFEESSAAGGGHGGEGERVRIFLTADVADGRR